MPTLNFIINNREELLLNSQVANAIEQINVCNTSSETILLSFFQLLKNTGENRYYLINNISLGIRETFVLQSVRLEKDSKLYVGVSGGSVSLNLVYLV